MGALADRSIVLLSKHAGAPRESWWLDTPPDHFTERATEEAQRMKRSRFGSIQLGPTDSDSKADRRRRLPV